MDWQFAKWFADVVSSDYFDYYFRGYGSAFSLYVWREAVLAV
ncbi:hypothetical protein [Candidatus Nanosynbacter featherlites]|nr:hypothetical protein [Candidatus Nanosynbacter featherlites]